MDNRRILSHSNLRNVIIFANIFMATFCHLKVLDAKQRKPKSNTVPSLRIFVFCLDFQLLKLLSGNEANSKPTYF